MYIYIYIYIRFGSGLFLNTTECFIDKFGQMSRFGKPPNDRPSCRRFRTSTTSSKLQAAFRLDRWRWIRIVTETTARKRINQTARLLSITITDPFKNESQNWSWWNGHCLGNQQLLGAYNEIAKFEEELTAADWFVPKSFLVKDINICKNIGPTWNFLNVRDVCLRYMKIHCKSVYQDVQYFRCQELRNAQSETGQLKEAMGKIQLSSVNRWWFFLVGYSFPFW